MRPLLQWRDLCHVRLEPEDDAGRLRSLGLPLFSAKAGSRRNARIRNGNSTAKLSAFQQPCAALEGCRCRIYADRPKYCREFECLLLKNLQAGRLEAASGAALFERHSARSKSSGCCGNWGIRTESPALSIRFRRMKQRMESGSTDAQSAEIFSRLTLAVHGLNLRLDESFYPAPTEQIDALSRSFASFANNLLLSANFANEREMGEGDCFIQARALASGGGLADRRWLR